MAAVLTRAIAKVSSDETPVTATLAMSVTAAIVVLFTTHSF